VGSLAEASLRVNSTQLELQLDGAPRPFVVPFPKPIDTSVAEQARFSRKSGTLKLTLRLERPSDGEEL